MNPKLHRFNLVALLTALLVAAILAFAAFDGGLVGGMAACAILMLGSHSTLVALQGQALGLTLTNLDDERFANRALEGFVTTLLPLSVFSTDFSDAPPPEGNNVLVELIGSLTATTFAGTYEISGGASTVITVPINRHRFVPVGQDDLTRASSSRAKLEKYGFQQGAGLALAVLQDVFSLLTTANFGLATAVSVVDFGVAQIRAGRVLLGRANVPADNRTMILDIDPYDNLLGISHFIQTNLAGSDQTLRKARTGEILDFTSYETNALPGTNSVMGLIGHAAAIALAMRYLKPQEGHTYHEARPVADPESGITMGLRDFYNNSTGQRFRILECNYGYSVGISNGARLFKRLN